MSMNKAVCYDLDSRLPSVKDDFCHYNAASFCPLCADIMTADATEWVTCTSFADGTFSWLAGMLILAVVESIFKASLSSDQRLWTLSRVSKSHTFQLRFMNLSSWCKLFSLTPIF